MSDIKVSVYDANPNEGGEDYIPLNISVDEHGLVISGDGVDACVVLDVCGGKIRVFEAERYGDVIGCVAFEIPAS